MAFDVNGAAKRAALGLRASTSAAPLEDAMQHHPEAQAAKDRLRRLYLEELAEREARRHAPGLAPLSSYPAMAPGQQVLRSPAEPAAPPPRIPVQARGAFKGEAAHGLIIWIRRLANRRGCSDLAAAEAWVTALDRQSGSGLLLLAGVDSQRITGDVEANRSSGGERPIDAELAARACRHVCSQLRLALEQALYFGNLDSFSALQFGSLRLGLIEPDAVALFPELGSGSVSALAPAGGRSGLALVKPLGGPPKVERTDEEWVAMCSPPPEFKRSAYKGWTPAVRSELLRQKEALMKEGLTYQVALIYLHKGWGYTQTTPGQGGALAKRLSQAVKDRTEAKVQRRASKA